MLKNGGAVDLSRIKMAGAKEFSSIFFGRKASTYKSIGLLAMQYKVPVVVGCARRINDQFKFRLKCRTYLS